MSEISEEFTDARVLSMLHIHANRHGVDINGCVEGTMQEVWSIYRSLSEEAGGLPQRFFEVDVNDSGHYEMEQNSDLSEAEQEARQLLNQENPITPVEKMQCAINQALQQVL